MVFTHTMRVAKVDQKVDQKVELRFDLEAKTSQGLIKIWGERTSDGLLIKGISKDFLEVQSPELLISLLEEVISPRKGTLLP